MIQFNKLEVNSSKDLVVDVAVKDKSYYKDVYLGELYIDTQDTYKDNGPSDKALKFNLVEETYKRADDKFLYLYDRDYSDVKKGLEIEFKNESYKEGIYLTFCILYKTDYLRSTDIYTLELYNYDTDKLEYTIKSDSIEIIDYENDRHTILIKTGLLNVQQYKDHYYLRVNVADSKGQGGIPNLIEDLKNNNIYNGLELDIYLPQKVKTYVKSKSIEIPKNAYPSLDDNILYIYAKVSDNSVPSTDTPCGEDNIYSLGVLIDNNKLYNIGINYIKSIGNDCTLPNEFINYILEYKAFNLAIATKNYTQANTYWNDFYKDVKVTNTSYGCGCNK